MCTTPLRRAAAVTAAAGLTLSVAACSSGSSSSGVTAENGVTTLQRWTYNGGNEAELAINEKIIADFNASQELRPATIGISYSCQLNVSWGQLMAYASLITIPVLAFFLAFQRAFIASIASAGVKG